MGKLVGKYPPRKNNIFPPGEVRKIIDSKVSKGRGICSFPGGSARKGGGKPRKEKLKLPGKTPETKMSKDPKFGPFFFRQLQIYIYIYVFNILYILNSTI